MKITSLKLFVAVTGIAFLSQSCSGPTYAQGTPPPAYTEPPPPPPPPVYTDPAPPQQAYSDQAPQQNYDAPPPISNQTFYDELSPYGQWVNSPLYGYVWVPNAGPDFQPYGTAGHWVFTNYGWTWVSDYSWGWAPFHYGTWDFDSFYGWYWIPGYQWSPAWVSWRSSPGYYGWCPLGPTYASAGYATYSCPPERYVFVRATYINSPVIVNYYEPRTQYATYYSRSTVVSNTYYDNSSHNTYYAGPPREEVERNTGAPVRPVTVVQTSTPEREGGSGNEVRMFRPAVQQPVASAATRPAPQKVYQKNDIAPINQRSVLTQPNQARVAPYKPESTQHSSNQATEQNRQQPPFQQQRPPIQEQKPPMQQQPAAQPQQQRPPVQQPPVQQQQRQPQPAQQPQRQQQQQRPKQQKPPKQKPAKQSGQKSVQEHSDNKKQ